MIRGRFPAARLAVLLGLLLAGIFLFTGHVALPWTVTGSSMEPTLAVGDLVIVDIWSYRYREPRTGEIVLVIGPLPDDNPLVKRVAAAPAGDSGEHGTGLWLLGDNAENSTDSRHFGPVPVDRIRGRIVWRYWPLARFGRIR
jgi:nickel-type superoxide dismutase maturation protease